MKLERARAVYSDAGRPVKPPRRRRVAWLVALVAACLLAACAPDRPPPPDPGLDPTLAWARRLREVVSPAGEVDYTALRADPTVLRAFVGWVAAHGPETDRWRYTDDNRRLAYALNALNAVTIWAVVEGIDRREGGRPYARLRFRLDGEPVRYDRYVSHRVLATIEEPLAAAALVCGDRACPPLYDRLFEKKDIEERLVERMRRWASSGRLVHVEGDTLVFSPALQPWMRAFERHAGARSPCDVVAPYASEGLKAKLAGACRWRWGAWEGELDGG